MTKISHCGRTVTTALVAYDIRWEGDLSGSDVLWSMVVSSPDSDETVHLAYARSAGEFAGQYVEASTGRQPVAEDADVDDGEITVRFPANLVGVAVEWPVWTAVLTIDGEHVSQLVVPAA